MTIFGDTNIKSCIIIYLLRSFDGYKLQHRTYGPVCFHLHVVHVAECEDNTEYLDVELREAGSMADSKHMHSDSNETPRQRNLIKKMISQWFGS